MPDSTPIHRILVANRSEIAVRVLRAVRSVGLESVAVYSDVDREALHVRLADRSVAIGGATGAESYLNIDALLAAARAAEADAIHPGYGFLSESAEFARRVESEGLVFLGPRPETLEQFADKSSAYTALEALGVPPVRGDRQPPTTPAELHARAGSIGFPLLLKATGGGGGKGIRVVERAEDLEPAWRAARNEAEQAFASSDVILEKFLVEARHIEIQFLGDGCGGVQVFPERDCSLQRRHQKILEETPAARLDNAVRSRLLRASAGAVSAARYRGAGTLEFLVAPDGSPFFLEMNPRIQVEHPITEEVVGTDLVAAQIEIAAGRRLPEWTGDLDAVRFQPRGAAVEFRLTAEDPARGWLPSTGTVKGLRLPGGPGVRVDTALELGTVVTPHYDSLLAKIIAHGRDRDAAFARLRLALRETRVDGIATNLAFGLRLLDDAAVRGARTHCQYLESLPPGGPPPLSTREYARVAAAAAWMRRAAANGGLTSGRTREERETALPAWVIEPGQFEHYP